MTRTPAVDQALRHLGRAPLRAVYARNRPQQGSAVAHLVIGDDAASMCGVQRGEAAPAASCRSCLYRFANYTQEGRKVARDGAARAVRDYVALHAAIWQALERSEPQPAAAPWATERLYAEIFGNDSP
jgi:hypothetical protein